MTISAAKAPLAAQALQRLGYNQQETWVKEHEAVQKYHNKAYVQKLTPEAKLPSRATP